MRNLYQATAAIGPAASVAVPSIPTTSIEIDWQAFLFNKLTQQGHGIESYRVSGWQGRVWLKCARPNRSALMYGALNTMATAMRLPWLKASPSATGGKASSAVELRRLHELEQAGVRVPHVLAHTEGAILMQDALVGPDADDSVSLLHMIESHAADDQPEVALRYWQQGLQALLAVHAKNQYLSQAFSRNMVIGTSGQIGFVDFEDDPLEVMDLRDCKVRDLLCYLHSTAWPLAQADVIAQAQAFLAEWMCHYTEEDRQAFKQYSQRVRFLSKFPKQRRFGKDVVRIHYSYVLLSNAVKAI